MLTSSVRCEPLNSNKKAFQLKVNRLFSNRCIGYIENKFEQVFFRGEARLIMTVTVMSIFLSTMLQYQQNSDEPSDCMDN